MKENRRSKTLRSVHLIILTIREDSYTDLATDVLFIKILAAKNYMNLFVNSLAHALTILVEGIDPVPSGQCDHRS